MDVSQISLGTAALVIFIACLGFVFLRGILRMILGTLVLGGSLWVGFVVWQKTPGWCVDWLGKPVDWVSYVLPVVVFLVTFVLSRAVVNFFLSPFRRSADAGARTPGGIVFRLVLSLVSTGFLWLTGATLVHHFGSIAEVGKAGNEQQASWLDRALELKQQIAAVVPEAWLKRLDPLADDDHLSLAKWFAAQPERKLEPVIDPETGRPYPRAVVVDEPQLDDLASDGRFSTLMRHPLFQKALKDPEVREALKRNIER